MNSLTLAVENEIAVLTITRPAALNALNSETLHTFAVRFDVVQLESFIKQGFRAIFISNFYLFPIAFCNVLCYN